MQATNETRADSAKSQPARTTNGRKPTTRTARGARPGRREDRREWRPVRLGELIDAAMAGIAVAEVRS